MKRRLTVTWWFGLALIVTLAMVVRIAPWQSVFTPEHVNLVAADSHYYVRLAGLQLENPWSLVTFDPLLGPEGGRVYWPIGHTLAVAALLLTGHGEAAAAWAGPLLSALLLLLTVLLALPVLRRSGGLTAALLLALVPTVVSTGLIGEVDHHVHEAFFSLSSLVLLVRCLTSPSDRSGIALGVLLGAGRLFTTSAFVLIPPVFAALAFAALSERDRAESLRRPTAHATIAAGGIALLHAVATGNLTSLEYELASSFHLLLVVGCGGLAIGTIAWAKRRRRATALGMLAGLVCLIPLALESARAVGHLGRKDPLLAVVRESTPLATDPAFAVAHLGALLLLLPVAAVWVLRRGQRHHGALLVVLALLAAAGFQARFAPLLAGAAAFVVGLAAESLWRERTRLTLPIACAVTVVLLLGLPHFGPPPQLRPQYGTLRPTLSWMGGALPEKSVVLASPFLGHVIMLWSERSVIASPFSQIDEHAEGFVRANAFFAAPDEETGHRAAEHARATHVLATPAAFPSLEDSRIADATHWLLPAGCDADQRCLSAAGFRLLHSSEPTKAPAAYLFERVPGATVRGRGAPGAPVVARSQLRGPDPKQFVYERRTTVDSAGKFQLRVAYPTGQLDHATVVAAAYELQVGDQPPVTVEVSAAAVREGLEVPVAIPAGARPRADREAP